MDKKAILLQVLTKLQPHRELAEGFVVVITETDDPSVIDALWDVISTGIHHITDAQQKAQIHHAIQNLKTLETYHNTIAAQDGLEADKLLDDLLSI